MWPVSSTWLAALSQPHGRYTRMEAWYAGARVTAVPVESGSVKVTARNRIRRTLTAVVPEGYWPTAPSSALAPYGQQLKVWQGITDARGVLIGSEVPVFTGRVETVNRQRLAGKVTVTALDPFADVNDAQFEQPRVPVPPATVLSTIVSLVTEVRPGAGFIATGVRDASIPSSIMFDRDRGQAIDDLAAAVGAEVLCLPDGASWVIQPVPVLDNDTPVWTVADGTGGTLIRDVMGRSRTDVANRMVVHIEQPGGNPFTVTVTDSGPVTTYGGPYGIVVRHFSSPLIADGVQGQVAGQARLARSLGITRQRQLDVVPNPALDAGDVIAVDTSEGTEWHVADEFSVPLGVADVMTISTRSTATSAS